MDTSTEIIETQEMASENNIKMFCEKKKEILNERMKQLAENVIDRVCDSNIDEEKGVVETDVLLKQQVVLKDFLGDLEQGLNAHVLFAKHTRKMDEQHAVAYCIDQELGMVIITVNSYQYGIVDEMYFSFYDSLDTMFVDAKEILADNIFSKDNNVVMEEVMNFTELWKSFFE